MQEIAYAEYRAEAGHPTGEPARKNEMLGIGNCNKALVGKGGNYRAKPVRQPSRSNNVLPPLKLGEPVHEKIDRVARTSNRWGGN